VLSALAVLCDFFRDSGVPDAGQRQSTFAVPVSMRFHVARLSRKLVLLKQEKRRCCVA